MKDTSVDIALAALAEPTRRAVVELLVSGVINS
jgi:DNA-binding transcriptional ArsR family regulator